MSEGDRARTSSAPTAARARRRALPAHRDDPPRRDASRRGHRARPPARAPAAVLLARGARVPASRVRLVDPEESPRHHDLGARRRGRQSSATASRKTACARSISASTTRSSRRPRSQREPFLVYPARAWPHKNHERLFAAFAVLRRAAARARARPHGVRGPDAGGRPLARARVARRARGAVPQRLRSRVPQPLRRLRPAADRGDGLRLPRRELERRVAAGGLRRRGAALRPDVGRGHARGDGGDPRPARRVERQGNRARCAVLVGENGAHCTTTPTLP